MHMTGQIRLWRVNTTLMANQQTTFKAANPVLSSQTESLGLPGWLVILAKTTCPVVKGMMRFPAAMVPMISPAVMVQIR